MVPLVLSLFLLLVGSPAHAGQRDDTITQVSTYGALQAALYQPVMSYERLQTYGDFGIGTFEAMDGEMVAEGGDFFQVPFSGRARAVRPSQTTPFAVVTFFDADRRFRLNRQVDQASLGTGIDARLPTVNALYAIRVTGRFSYVQTRSVARQTTPYPPLSEVVAGNRTFDLRNVRGTLVGFRFPSYVGSANVPGYHWHFVTEDGTAGGHMLTLRARGLKVAVDVSRDWQVILPDTAAFDRADMP